MVCRGYPGSYLHREGGRERGSERSRKGLGGVREAACGTDGSGSGGSGLAVCSDSRSV